MTEFEPTPRPPKTRTAFDRAWKGPTPQSIFNTRRPEDTEPPAEDTDDTTEPDPMRTLARNLFAKPTNTDK